MASSGTSFLDLNDLRMCDTSRTLAGVLAFQRTLCAASFDTAQELLRRTFDEHLVPLMIECLMSGDPLSYVAARHLRLFVAQPEFSLDADDASLTAIAFSLIKSPPCMLRLELVLLLEEMTTFESTLTLLKRNQPLLRAGFAHLVSLLTLPTATPQAAEAASLSSSSSQPQPCNNIAPCVWREERSAILRILLAASRAQHIRSLLQSLAFSSLCVDGSATGVGSGNAAASVKLAAVSFLRPSTVASCAPLSSSTSSSSSSTSSAVTATSLSATGATHGLVKLLSDALADGDAQDDDANAFQTPLAHVLAKPDRVVYQSIVKLLLAK